MYGVAFAASSAAAIPFFYRGELINVGLPIQAFGVIVAAGVLIGAGLLRRYAEWHGVSDELIRKLTGWIVISGFLGAHILDVIMYEPQKFDEDIASWPPSMWPAIIRVWDGISSYGGFVGGAIGFAVFVWWKRLPARLFADMTIVGLLPAFSIGRIGCTVVSDHIGSVVDPNAWYAFLAESYPTHSTEFHTSVLDKLIRTQQLAGHPIGDHILAWNLGLIEFLYLVPVNLLVLWLAFRPDKRTPAGFVTVLTGVVYAPVRFFLDFLRPEDSDPRHIGLTFAQWASLIAFGAAVYAAMKIWQHGEAAKTVTRTSKEAQQRLKTILKEGDEIEEEPEEKKEEKKEEPVAETEKVPSTAPPSDPPSTEEEEEEEEGDAEEPANEEAAEPAKAPAPKPGGAKKKNKKKKRR
jgi:phosphatidylglycerol---prolipoprotein diacylglyceryl transferase